MFRLQLWSLPFAALRTVCHSATDVCCLAAHYHIPLLAYLVLASSCPPRSAWLAQVINTAMLPKWFFLQLGLAY
jgi:hypothetical protein